MKGPELSTLNLSQLSILSGKTRDTVRRKLDGALQPIGGDGRTKLYAAPAALGIIFGTGEGVDLTAERAKLARAQTEAAELRNAVTRGELIEASELMPQITMATTACKSAVQGTPNRFRQQVPHLTAAEVELLRDLLDHALHEYADALLSICPEPGLEGDVEGSPAETEADPLGVG